MTESFEDQDYIEGIKKLTEIVIYLNSSGILDMILDLLKSGKLISVVKSPTFKAIVELLGDIQHMIDSGEVKVDDFINGFIAIAKHLDKIGKVVSTLDQHGVLDVMTSGLSKAAERIIKENSQSNIIELLASFDDPDVKMTLAFLQYMLKELGKSTKPLVNKDDGNS
ncbi:hypothetical protein BFU36_00235 [Sulfolobus sp. A20]|uniref:hypothetical protein n=1 Tax=Sulfolobaceae TaxID=118883 RepID=UPI00084616B9|nr:MULTISPECIES: hypothetical protein [unclassified Sulfolobus]TRM77677.1 hypothetical protein DJ532_03495 [Sulfolobus sp. A20-N-F8]TRM79550.1 hypothetical protein DJ528_00770 [Sulfolobus sp. B5]TRM82272.1 hypothetical protein DJ524_01080 [Sulfolobus sp. D5]TRM85158.1 hypothetical protein DJ522_01795 [Sulfolobus sp. F3]TRM87486.1 hypothetical protein DJ529_08295 [Sulfolobus sp. C3]TRM90031.1 hypothetical protein DJ526_07615 [Sulfolobus sp. A20-N-G8]TRN00730.1 hypothetical protein DJ530_07000